MLGKFLKFLATFQRYHFKKGKKRTRLTRLAVKQHLNTIQMGGIPSTLKLNNFIQAITAKLKVARYSFSGSVPPKFEHKLRRHKQSFGKIATTVVLVKDENLL